MKDFTIFVPTAQQQKDNSL